MPKKVVHEEKGVSPIIGVILIVAIVIILASLLSFTLFGFSNQLEGISTDSVSLDSSNDGKLSITKVSGDISKVVVSNGESSIDLNGIGDSVRLPNGEYNVYTVSKENSRNLVKTVNITSSPHSDSILKYPSSPKCDKNISLNGSGTSSNPYKISNVYHLQCIKKHPDSDFELVSDVNGAATEVWNNGAGFEPISYSGNLDGNNHNIKKIYINREENQVGIFKQSSGHIKNLTVRRAKVSGDSSTGVIAGSNNGQITNTHVINSNINSGSNTGGIAGTGGNIYKSSARKVTVSGGSNTGGIVGKGTGIYKSFTTGEINGGTRTGGIVGSTGENTVVKNSYSHAEISGAGYTAGIAGDGGGYNGYHDGYVRKSYATGPIETSSPEYMGPVIGGKYTYYFHAYNSYWNTDNIENTVNSEGNGLTTSEMQGVSAEENMNFDFNNTWKTTSGYPELQWED